MAKIKNYGSLYLKGDAYEAKRDGKSIVKIQVYEGPFGKEPLLGTIFMPMSTYDMGWPKFHDAMRSRIKHDLNITYDHNSASGY